MGITSIIFIVILLAVSGFVAWAGDVLGSVLGKRRIALFGLRPRRTSVLIAVITGILITGGTILALYILNEDIRYTLTRMDQIRRETAELTEDRDRLVTENNEFMVSMDYQQTVIRDGQLAIDMLSEQLSTAQDELIGLYNDTDDLQIQLGDLNSDIDSLGAERDALQAVNAEKAAEVAGLEEQIVANIQLINTQEARVAVLNSGIETLRAEVGTLTGQVQSYETGEVKVYEGQQLVVFSINTRFDINTIYNELRNRIAEVSRSYVDPSTGQRVLAFNNMEITSEQYVQALEDIRAVNSNYAIVIVTAAENVVENQPVPITLEVSRNYKVYSQDSLIYSNSYTTLDESAEQSWRAICVQFFEDTRNYLVNDRSLIPITSGEALQMTIDDLVELAQILEDVGLPAEMRIIALTDIYRTDFLVYGEQFTVTILPVPPVSEGIEPE